MSLNLPRVSLHFPSCSTGHVLNRHPLNLQCEAKEEMGKSGLTSSLTPHHPSPWHLVKRWLRVKQMPFLCDLVLVNLSSCSRFLFWSSLASVNRV
jgi:hypothetical protein